MADIKDVIFSRRSIRWFKKEPVPDKDIDDIISAGIRAPTASAGEQWHFVCVTSEENRKKMLSFIKKGQMAYLSRALRSAPAKNEIDKWNEMFVKGIYDAPAYIIGLLDYSTRTLNDEYINYERMWGIESVTLALGNMMLLAWSKGYGTVFIAVPKFYEEDLKESLGLPAKMEYAGMLALGKPAEMPELKPRKPLKITKI
ncbi:MAG: nitroreductase family protein [Nitrososphaerota archaeon]|nr:nitroreductase family protein [Nitrososphaerota archaeon]